MSKHTCKNGLPHKHVGIRWRLFASIAGFTLLILVAQWVFQIRLLGFFYEREKFSDMTELAGELAGHVQDSNFAEQVTNCGRDKQVCIRVFRVGLGGIEQIADADAAADCVIHHLSPGRLLELYEKAKAGGGEYDERKKFEYTGREDEVEIHVPGIHHGFSTTNAIHAKVLEGGDGEYLLILDCELSPVGAIVRTLEVQFIWIVGVLLVGALLVSYITSRIITRPLAEITRNAGRLATGEYQTVDLDHGYREVQELAAALNHAAEEIRASDRLKKELLANISHDLRTPLTMIKGYGEVMRDIPGENTPENIQAVIDEATRLSELVNDLLDLSKLQAGTQKLNPTVFDLSATVRDVMHRYDVLIAHEGYRIELVSAGEAPVEADRTMILQVIYNLINNAVNYTGESRRVVVREEIRGDRVRLSVMDDGEGIPPDQIAEIWDRYYRVDKVHKRAVMGTGLGLSIVKSVLEAHTSATYGVDSALGVGSVFWFELPLAKK